MKLRPLALALCLAAPAAFAAEPLTIAQVEKVTGLSGLATKPGKYDKAATNFVTPKDDLVLSVKQAPASVYAVWKSQPSMDDQAALPGIGEEAVVSRKGRYICFRKADRGVCVIGMAALPNKPAPVNEAQLAELARLAAASL